MGTKERKEREREQKRALILNAAIELISKLGFENTTMDEIAQKAEFSKGTLYLYFNDKSDLFSAIKLKGLEIIQARFGSFLRKDATGSELVLNMVDDFINFIHENTVYAQAIILPEMIAPKSCEFHRVGNEILTILTHALQIGVQDGSILRKINPRTTAVQIGMFIFGTIQFFYSDSDLPFSKILSEQNSSIKQMMHQTIKEVLLNNETNLTLKNNE